MKTALIIATFAATVCSQTLDYLLNCALDCFQIAVTSVTDCSSTDYACACKSADAVVTQGQPCVLATCDVEVAAGNLSWS
ncbi:hypothetical protein CCMA1212_005154 [Trichoderma ghanense]|uniref:CFEM domain-containing protein n=1 Tax=Trichoderma ghanense TaxID=65468 RepID=A0ABY2H2J9_9HYPO